MKTGKKTKQLISYKDTNEKLNNIKKYKTRIICMNRLHKVFDRKTDKYLGILTSGGVQ